MEGERNEAADSLGKVFNAVWRKFGDKLRVDRLMTPMVMQLYFTMQHYCM